MQNPNSNIEQQYRVLTIIWFVLLFSQAMFFIVVYLTKPDVFNFDSSKPFLGDNLPVVVAFAFLAITNLVISFVMKRRSIEQATAEQKMQHLQTGLIIGCALCEAVSLLGLILAIAFSYQYFFLWFALGILGIILHFPKRDNLLAAKYRK